MRTIKFRGRDFYGVWVYGDLHHKRYTAFATHMIEELTGFGSDVIPETVGQFTGLFDKNGNEIYEGDILKFIDDTTIPTECITDVFWWNEMQCFSLKNTNHNFNWLEVEDMEVIGNIHDNPELIK